MNLQIHRVLNDITGLSGLRILDAILAGEQDPVTLARLCHGGVKSSEDTIAKSLEGDYRPEHLFALRQSLAFHYYQQLVVEVDQKINVNSAVWRQRQPRNQQYPNEPRLPHINCAATSRRRSTSAVSCIESSESISPMCLASARLQPKPSSARSAQMCPGFAMLPPLHPGWDFVLRTRSVLASPLRYAWRPTRCIMQKIISVSFFGASLGNSANPKQSLPQLTNSLGLFTICSALKKPTTRMSFTAATKTP